MNNINLPPNERWIDGYDGIYSITESAEVISYKCRKRKILKPAGKNDGYLSVVLSKDGIKTTRNIHRCVAVAFLDNPNQFTQVNHIDGNKSNNNISNLEWCNASHNAIHAFRMGLKPCKLTINDVNEIKLLISKANHTLTEISRIFNVSYTCIQGVSVNKHLKRFL